MDAVVFSVELEHDVELTVAATLGLHDVVVDLVLEFNFDLFGFDATDLVCVDLFDSLSVLLLSVPLKFPLSVMGTFTSCLL
jgi:hypothetical protein